MWYHLHLHSRGPKRSLCHIEIARVVALPSARLDRSQWTVSTEIFRKCRHLVWYKETSLSAHLALFTIGIYLHTKFSAAFNKKVKRRASLGNIHILRIVRFGFFDHPSPSTFLPFFQHLNHPPPSNDFSKHFIVLNNKSLPPLPHIALHNMPTLPKNRKIL